MHQPIFGMHDPIFADARLFLEREFVLPIGFRRRRRENFHDQIRRADAALVLKLAWIADHDNIRLHDRIIRKININRRVKNLAFRFRLQEMPDGETQIP